MAKTNKKFEGAPEETPIIETSGDSSFSLESRQVTPEVTTVGATYEVVVGGSVHIRQDN
jgi:hypothetical protein